MGNNPRISSGKKREFHSFISLILDSTSWSCSYTMVDFSFSSSININLLAINSKDVSSLSNWRALLKKVCVEVSNFK